MAARYGTPSTTGTRKKTTSRNSDVAANPPIATPSRINDAVEYEDYEDTGITGWNGEPVDGKEEKKHSSESPRESKSEHGSAFLSGTGFTNPPTGGRNTWSDIQYRKSGFDLGQHKRKLNGVAGTGSDEYNKKSKTRDGRIGMGGPPGSSPPPLPVPPTTTIRYLPKLEDLPSANKPTQQITVRAPPGPSQWPQHHVVIPMPYYNHYEKRRMETPADRMMVPIGKPEDHDLAPRDLVYTLADGDGTLFACANGLPRDAKVRFAGAIYEGSTVDSQTSKSLTVVLAGNITVTNNGSSLIQPGNLIAFSGVPDVVPVRSDRPGGGVENRPLLRDSGRSSVFSSSRYPFPIYTFCHRDPALLLSALRKNVCHSIARYTSTTATRLQILNNALVNAFESLSTYVKDDHPVYSYLYWIIAQRAADEWGGEYNDSVYEGLPGKTYGETTYEDLKTLVSWAIDGEIKQSGVPRDAIEQEDLFVDIPRTPEDAERHFIETKSFIHSRIDIAVCNINDWCATFIIGSAISPAKPGEDVDLIIGYKR